MTDGQNSSGRGSAGLSRRDLLRTAAGVGLVSVAEVGVGRGAGGDLRWSVQTGESGFSSPTVVAGTVFIGGQSGLYALRAGSGEQVWSFGTDGRGPFTAPAVLDRTVFVGTGTGAVGGYALSVDSGDTEWRFDPPVSEFTGVTTLDGEVIMQGFAGTVHVLSPETGDILQSSNPTMTEDLVRGAATTAAGTVLLSGTAVGETDGTVYAYSVARDELRWAVDTGVDVRTAATVAGGTVFTADDEGTVRALAFESGEQLWVTELGATVRSSPTVADGTVYLGSDDGTLHALSAASGEQEWTFQTGGQVRSAPTVAGGRVFVGSDDSSVYALSGASGEQVWGFQTDGQVRSAPTVVDGTVYVGSTDGSDASSRGSRVTLRTLGHNEVGGSQQQTVVIQTGRSNPPSGTPLTLTARTTGRSDSSEWDLTGDGSVDATGRTVSRAFEPGIRTVTLTVTGQSGETTASRSLSVRPPRRWQFGAGSGVESSPTVAGDTVFVGSRAGTLYALAAASGEQRWTLDTDRALSSPVVVDGIVFAGGRTGTVYALDAVTGESVWVFNIDGSVLSSPTVAGGTVFVGTRNSGVYALSAATGEQRWRFQTERRVDASPTVDGNTVFVGDRGGTVSALAAVSGGRLWTFSTGGAVESSPTVADGAVFLGDNNGRVYALEVVSGERRWTVETGDSVVSSPTVADGTVYRRSRVRARHRHRRGALEFRD